MASAVLLLYVTFFILSSQCFIAYSRKQLPNIVIFFGDDLGFGDLSMYGHPTSSTPNLARLAAGGKLFTQFYAAAAVCSPSRAALLTGRYAMRSGIYPNVFDVTSSGGLPFNETTIAEMLQPLGYHSAMVGKWHLGLGKDAMYLPPNHGFDEYLGLPASPCQCPCTVCFYPNITCHRAPCETQFTACALYNGTTIVEQPVDLLTLDDKYVAQARRTIATNAQAGQPFFLYYASQHTHHVQYAGKQTTGTTKRGQFGDSLAAMDWEVGEIYGELEFQGILEETLFLFTADNGPSLTLEEWGGNAGPLKCGKGTVYEGGVRVPAIAHWPGRIAPGSRSRDLASNLDFLPTIAAITGAPLPNVTLDGFDMSPILFEGKPSERDTFYYYPPSGNIKYKSFAVRHKQYKAVFYTQGSTLSNNKNKDKDCRHTGRPVYHDPPMLFDLDLDPSENYNLTGRSRDYDAIIERLTKMRAQFDSKMAWAESDTKKPTSPDYMPCCNPGCSPFPQCCHCTKGSSPAMYNRANAYLDLFARTSTEKMSHFNQEDL